MGRFSRHILLALFALGVALRIRQYTACPSYWYDEAYLLLNVFHKSFVDLLGPLREDQAAPPLFLWLLRGLYQLVGGSEWWMRLPALAASLAGLLLMMPLARRVAGRRGGLWAVAFCAFGHHAVAHAGEVKPYALDFLMTEAILLATLSWFPSRAWEPSPRSSASILYCLAGCWRRSRASQTCVPKQSLGTRRRGGGKLWLRIVLCVLAVLAPWASYPAVFVLGAASVALLVHAFRHRPAAHARAHITLACAAGWLSVLSSLILWRLAVRHQATSTLRAFWASSFLDLSSPGAAVAWMGRCLIEIGNYGTREMGLPLVMLAFVGAVSLRRRPARLVLLMGPLLLALLASALRLYPLGGRLLFFLVPCLWLLAARGIDVLIRRLFVRWVWLGWILPMALLVPTLLWVGRLFVVVTPRCQFREAFAYVERQREPGDVLWVSHPQVYEVYHGRAPDLSAYSSPELVEQAARTGRLWMVCAVAGSRERYTAAETVARVKAAPCIVFDHRRFRGLEVVLYGPPTETGSSPPSVRREK